MNLYKNSLIVFFLLFSSAFFSQIDSELLVGAWKFEAPPAYQESDPHSLEPIPEFTMTFTGDGTFTLEAKEDKITGTYLVNDSTISMTARATPEEDLSTEKLHIYSVSRDSLVVSEGIEIAEKHAMVFYRLPGKLDNKEK